MDHDVDQSYIAVPPALVVECDQQLPQRVSVLASHVVREVEDRHQPLHLDPARIEAVQLRCGPGEVLVCPDLSLPALVLFLGVVLQDGQPAEVQLGTTHRRPPPPRPGRRWPPWAEGPPPPVSPLSRRGGERESRPNPPRSPPPDGGPPNTEQRL